MAIKYFQVCIKTPNEKKKCLPLFKKNTSSYAELGSKQQNNNV